MKSVVPVNISSDPEFFIRNKKTGAIVSSIPIVKNTKEKPADLGGGVLCYVDNVAVECSLPVVNSRAGFIDLIQSTINKINGFIGENYEAVPLAAYSFPDEELTHPGANEIGCSPFFIGRTLEQAMPPELPKGYRSAGFHLHIGREDFKTCEDDWAIDPMSKVNIGNAMDVYVGIPSVIFDNSEESRSRKKIYTQSCSAHRPTKYGVEYRPLSSGVMRNPELVGLVYDLSMLAINKSQETEDFGVSDEEAFQCIDGHDVNLSKQIMARVLSEEMINRVMQFSEK